MTTSAPETPRGPRERGPYAALALDVLIAVALVLGVSLVCAVGWGLVRAIALTRQGLDAAQAMQHLGTPGPIFQVASTVLAMGGAALALLWWRRRPDAGERSRSLDAARRPSTWAWALGTAIATSLAVAAITQLAASAGSQPDASNEALVRGLMTQSPWMLWPFAVVLAPIYEETLFRRVFFGRMLAADRPYAGVCISAVLFAIAHEPPGLTGNGLLGTSALLLAYASMGAGFALVYRRTGTLWAAILAHMLHNFFACLMLWFGA